MLGLTLWGLLATSCISVRTTDESGASDGGSADAGAADVTLGNGDAATDASGVDASDAGVASDASTCPFSGAQGFCEDFDTAALPGAFASIVQESGGTLTSRTTTATTGTRSMLAKAPGGASTNQTAALETTFASDELSVEFDLRPEKLHSGPKVASAYVVRVQFDETRSGDEPYHMLGLVVFASNGVGALKLVDFKGLTNKYTARDPAFPLTLGAWIRLRLMVTRAGFVTVHDVASNTIIASDRIDLNADVKPTARLRVGFEAYTENFGFELGYDSIVVGKR